jgi:hypothetical protein
MRLEEDNVALQTTIREMEEAAEITAEMEEVQSDELKAVTLLLDGRDAIIHNLEEAKREAQCTFTATEQHQPLKGDCYHNRPLILVLSLSASPVPLLLLPPSQRGILIQAIQYASIRVGTILLSFLFLFLFLFSSRLIRHFPAWV